MEKAATLPLLDARFVLCRRFADLRTGSVAACQEGAPCRAELKRTQEALQAGQHQAASLARLPEPGEVSGVIVAAVFLCSAWPSTRAGNLEWRYLFLSLSLSLSLTHSHFRVSLHEDPSSWQGHRQCSRGGPQTGFLAQCVAP